MENTINHIDELIGKYLADEATPVEAHQIMTWANQSESNQKYLAQIKMIFEGASVVKDLHHFDEDAAWQKMKAKLKTEAKVIALKPETSSFKLFLRIAASIVIVLGVGFFIYRSTQSNKQEVIANNKTVTDKLPDGSGVVLNKQTQLSYIYDKIKKEHIVKLKGEAYFNIKHEDKKKFVIDVEGAFIRDIGTSFNVKAYPESNTIEVFVEEGIVEFFTAKDSGILLHASAKGTYNKSTGIFTIENPEQNIASYKTKFFSFSNASLKEVVADLNSVYDKKIILANNIKTCHLTVTFNNEDIDEIASIISETLGLKLKSSPTEIVLEGQGCD